MIVFHEEGRLLLHRRVVGEAWAPPSGSVVPGEGLVRYCARPPFALERLHAMDGNASLTSP